MSDSNSLFRFPGFLGWTSKGVVALHANWPSYPVEHGWYIALLSLGMFPKDSVFREISNIDRCYLFFVGDPSQVKDPFNEKYFHVAVWHEDLLELAKKGYITGVHGITEYENAVREYDQAKSYYIKINQEYVNVQSLMKEPDPEYYEELFGYSLLYWADIDDTGVQITPDGYKALSDLLVEQQNDIDLEVWKLAEPLLSINRYDTAVREACLLVEARIKEITGNNLYGIQLVDHLFSDLSKSNRYIPSQLKIFRTEVKAIFKFIRNDYMHNFKTIDLNQCLVLLFRVSLIMRTLRAFRNSTE